MWQSYKGFTFAFNDYLDAGLAPYFDDEKLAQAGKSLILSTILID